MLVIVEDLANSIVVTAEKIVKRGFKINCRFVCIYLKILTEMKIKPLNHLASKIGTYLVDFKTEKCESMFKALGQ